MVNEKNTEAKVILVLLSLLFGIFLLYPLALMVLKSLQSDGGISFANYIEVFSGKGFAKALLNSVWLSSFTAIITTSLGFLIAYTINYTNIASGLKKMMKMAAVLPMMLPTITYGFAILYSFGKQGLLTKLFGRQLFQIYGVNGLLLGYVIYTLPVSFLLLNNTMGYIDKKFSVVSKMMGDSGLKTLSRTVIRPLVGTLAVSFIQCFFLCFTDYGIPASVGGKFEVVATLLYNQMLGSVPNFNNGAAVAVVMLLPSLLSISILRWLERFNIRYDKVSQIEIEKNKARDWGLGLLSTTCLLFLLSVFGVILILPMIKGWPYDIAFTWDQYKSIFRDSAFRDVCINSVKAALCSAAAGTLVSFVAAVVTERSILSSKAKLIIESIASITNTIPGMVLGIAYMLAFKGSSLQNTFTIIVICNVVHFFATPYMMMKNTLSKMNLTWEKTAKLMGDNWIKTLIRIIIPNSASAMIEAFNYYFVNAMVTVSAVIFLAGAKTMVLTTKIKELQHFEKFNEVFVLSIFILIVNLIAKRLSSVVTNRSKKKRGELW